MTHLLTGGSLYYRQDEETLPVFALYRRVLIVFSRFLWYREYVFVSGDNFDFEVVGYDPDILNIVNTYSNKENINPHMVNPVYLKLTEAEENRLNND